MRIDIKRLDSNSSAEERSLDFSCGIDMSDVRLWGEAPYPEPVWVEGRVSVRADIVTVNYRAKYTRFDICSRCLSPLKIAREDEFEHIILEGNDDEDSADIPDGYIPAPDGIFDVDRLVLTDILLLQDGTSLCSPECKGLCLKCGANLNKETCSCVLNEPDPRFAALRELLEQSETEEASE